MLRLPSVRIGHLFGIPIEINLSWLLVFAIVSWTLSTGYYPTSFPGRHMAVDVVSGVLTALLFFASLVAHELSHSLVAVRRGIRVERVTLFVFGAIAQLADEPRSPGTEIAMALAGPGMSLTLSGVCFAAYRALFTLGASDAVWAPVMTLSVVNLSVAVFNLAPGFPMDGGRVLRSFLWWVTGERRSATFAASLVGQALGVAIAALGAWALVERQLEGIWFVALGLFLRLLAGSAYAGQEARMRLAGTPVSELMASPVPLLRNPAGDHAGSPASHGFPGDPIAAVVETGRLTGVVRAPGTSPEAPPVGLMIDGGESAETAARRFSGSAFEALLVVSGGRLVGYLTRSQVGERLSALGEDSRTRASRARPWRFGRVR